MQISVIIAVYNEEKNIVKCLEALVNQDFPKEQYEIIVVNDKSTDNTAEVIGKYVKMYPDFVKLINLFNNKGRIIARITGANNAKYDLLLSIDSRCIASTDLLTTLERIEYQPAMSGHVPETMGEKSLFARVINLFRLKYYSTEAWGKKEYWINEYNFNRSPKGTTCLFIHRDLFLECQPSSKGRHINDDTKILKEVVKRKSILRHQDVKVKYLARSESKSALKHIFYRGPLFQDYYLCRGGIYYKYFVASVITGLILLTLGIFIHSIWLYYLLAFVLGIFGIGFYLSKNVNDFFVVLLYFPLIAGTFVSGILYGKVNVWLSTIKKKIQRKGRL